MFSLHLSYQNIYFRHPSSSSSIPISLPTLPRGITRSFIHTSLGNLEILQSSPSSSPTRQPALFFIHGGMGSASVWLEYLSFFSAQAPERPCYAVSMRGHGGSSYPSYLGMVYGTMKGDLAGDVVSGIEWAVERENERLALDGLGRGGLEGSGRGEDGKQDRRELKGKEKEVEMVLVGHSSGGGLAQYILSAGLLDGVGVKIKGLVLMGAVPGFGSLGVYLNWFRLDPLFTIRLLFHLWHPNSPLSHPALVRRVFFSDQLSESYLLKFMSFMNRYESFLWSLGMGWRFVDPEKVLLGISGWGETRALRDREGGEARTLENREGRERERVLVIAGSEDKIMTQDIMQKLANWYRAAYKRLAEGKKIDADGMASEIEGETMEESRREKGQEGGRNTESSMGVRYAVVPGAGHHCQNDLGWEVGAEKVLGFYRGLL